MEVADRLKLPTPDLRHFCHVLDNDNWETTQLTVAIGGLDKAKIQAAIAHPAEVNFVSDTDISRLGDQIG